MGTSTYAKASKNARMMVLEHGKNKGTRYRYEHHTIAEHSTYHAVDIKVRKTITAKYLVTTESMEFYLRVIVYTC